MGGGALASLVHQAVELLQAGAVVLRQLAPEQVEGLDAVGAFVDGVESVVAVVLLHRVFAGVAVAAEDLDGQFVGLEAELGGPGLDDGGEQVEQFVGLLAGAVVGESLGVVEQARGIQAEVEGAFDVGLLGEQQAAYVGVLDDRDLWAARVLAVRVAALGPVAGVVQ